MSKFTPEDQVDFEARKAESLAKLAQGGEIAAQEMARLERFVAMHDAVAHARANVKPEVSGIHSGGAYFDWGWKGIGYGQLSFHYDRIDERITIDNECMSRDTVRKLLHAFADFIADRAYLGDSEEGEDLPPVDFKAEVAAEIARNQEAMKHHPDYANLTGEDDHTYENL